MTDRPILVVTGASRGIGAACAVLGARQGYDVAVNYLASRDQAEAVAEEARRAGARALVVKGDMGREEDVVSLFEAVDRSLGPVAALVNNAGVLGAPMTVDQTDGAALARMLSLNVAGYVLCLREASRRMIEAGSGAIVNIGSRLSELGGAGGATVYAATKGAITTFTVGAARELAPMGIRVNCVSPGVIETEIHAAAGLPDRPRELAPLIPMGRTGSAEEVAEAVLWLLSEKASYTTGALLTVSGGR